MHNCSRGSSIFEIADKLGHRFWLCCIVANSFSASTNFYDGPFDEFPFVSSTMLLVLVAEEAFYCSIFSSLWIFLEDDLGSEGFGCKESFFFFFCFYLFSLSTFVGFSSLSSSIFSGFEVFFDDDIKNRVNQAKLFFETTICREKYFVIGYWFIDLNISYMKRKYTQNSTNL